MSRKKLKRKAKWETEIDLQVTKTEQSQRLWRNVQNSIKRWRYTITCILIFIDSTQVLIGNVSVQCCGCGPWAAGNVLSGPSLKKVAQPWFKKRSRNDLDDYRAISVLLLGPTPCYSAAQKCTGRFGVLQLTKSFPQQNTSCHKESITRRV